MGARDVKVTQYNYATKETEVLAEKMPVRALAHSMDVEQLASLVSDMLNGGRIRGKDFGKLVVEDHPSLQTLTVKFMVDALVAYAGESDYTDPRNEKAVKLAKAIAKVVSDFGPLPVL